MCSDFPMQTEDVMTPFLITLNVSSPSLPAAVYPFCAFSATPEGLLTGYAAHRSHYCRRTFDLYPGRGSWQHLFFRSLWWQRRLPSVQIELLWFRDNLNLCSTQQGQKPRPWKDEEKKKGANRHLLTKLISDSIKLRTIPEQHTYKISVHEIKQNLHHN